VSNSIHPTAIVHPGAQLGTNVSIGPYTIVEDDVVVGNGTELMAHVVIASGARIGCDVRIHPGAVISTAPQDLKYDGAATLTIIGDRTVVRESATINKATTASGQTTVGSDVLVMAYAHVAHDCVVGNHVIIANATQLGGHTHIGEWAILGGLVGVHQFCRIGDHSMVAASAMVVKDVPPYILAGKTPLAAEAINTVGLRRRGFTQEEIRELTQFYKFLYREGLNISDALNTYASNYPDPSRHITKCIEFIRSSQRGIIKSAIR